MTPPDDPETPAGAPRVLSLVQARPVEAAALAGLLRALADEADRGDIIGLVVVTELTGGRIGSAYHPNDVHRLLGGLERVKHRLLTGA